MSPPNKPDAVNPAIALWLTIEDHWRRVTDLERSAESSMNTFNTIRRILLVGALLASILPAMPAESSGSAGTGVVSVAPQIAELGSGWGRREVIMAIDPLDAPAEYVNTIPGEKDPARRAQSMLEIKRRAMAMNGSVGMATVIYGYSGDFVELVISRYSDEASLEKHWKEKSAKFDQAKTAPKVGQLAGWLDTGSSSNRQYVLVFRQGLFTGWAESGTRLSGEPMMRVARATAAKMAKAAEPCAAPNAAPPQR